MLIYGRNPVLEAAKAGTTSHVWIAKGVDSWLVEEVKKLGITCTVITRAEMDKMAQSAQHQGLVAEVVDVSFSEPEAPFKLAKKRQEDVLLVVLDQVTDPRNYGAIIRSAVAMGAHGVITEERRSAPLSALVVKASAGTATKIPLVQVKNIARYLEELKKRNIWVYGTTGNTRTTVSQLDYKRPLAIVMGSEGEGMRRLVTQTCDELLKIPLAPEAESLNVAVALGIVLYHIKLSRS